MTLQSIDENNMEICRLTDYLEVVLKHKRMILFLTTGAFAASILVSLLLPVRYTADTLLVPSQLDQTLTITPPSGLSNLAGSVLGKPTPSDLYAGMLESKSVKDPVIDRFKLMELYGTKYRVDAYKKLNKTLTVEASKKSGIITLSVEDEDPKRAADIANAFTEELMNLLISLNTSGAGLGRKFLEERLVRVKSDMLKAAEALKNFSMKNKTIDMPAQTKATIEGIARLQAQLAAQEVQLATLRSYQTDSNQEVISVKSSIAGIKSQVSRMEGNDGGSSILGAGKVPVLGEEYARLMREYKIQENLFDLLMKNYEMAKMNEAKNFSAIQIIQKARTPDKKSKPERTFIVLISTVAAFLLSVFAAFVFEYLEKMPDIEKDGWKKLSRHFKSAR